MERRFVVLSCWIVRFLQLKPGTLKLNMKVVAIAMAEERYIILESGCNSNE